MVVKAIVVGTIGTVIKELVKKKQKKKKKTGAIRNQRKNLDNADYSIV